jgi:hypothetical protein
MEDGESLKDRWRSLVMGLAESLDGDWQVRGRGLITSLVRQPDPWTIAWVGFSKSKYSDDGWYHAGVESLVTYEFGWYTTFGVRMSELREWPRKVDLTDSAASDLLYRFAVGPAAEKIKEGSVERMAMASEKSFARPYDRRKLPHYWLMAPGWRTVLGTDSPVAPARDAIEFCRQRDIAEGLTFYQTLIDTWENEGREGALTFLKADRKRKVRAAGLHGMPLE